MRRQDSPLKIPNKWGDKFPPTISPTNEGTRCPNNLTKCGSQMRRQDFKTISLTSVEVKWRDKIPKQYPAKLWYVGKSFNSGTNSMCKWFRGWREPGNSIKDPGMARSGIGFLVLLLYENTWPGHDPCLAETVRSRSRERVPGLVWEWLAGTGRH